MLYPLLFLLLAGSAVALMLPPSYDVVWTEAGVNQSADSMPVGGGDIGLNVWYENGSILIYVAKSGTFDENNTLLKLGRLRISFKPDPFTNSFEQRLVLNDGYIKLKGSHNTTAKIWVDVFNPVAHFELESRVNMSANLAYENWRYEDRNMTGEERNQGSWGWYNTKLPNGTTYKDAIQFYGGGVLMSHRNEKLDLFNFQVEQQHLSKYKDTLYNPMKDNEFGLWIYSPDLETGNITSGQYINTTFKAWNLVSSTPKSSYKVDIAINQAQTESHSEWLSQLMSTTGSKFNNSQTATISWWHEFWDRSYIVINEDKGPADAGFMVGKNYQLWRYIMGTNAYSEWPTKFNGGLFTFDPVFVNSGRAFTPDHRRWGGGTFTAQNQRLLYWPLLRTGDFDLMKPQFDFYKRITPNALIRGQHYENLDAAYFLEQIDNTGLSNAAEYNAQQNSDDDTVQRPEFFPPGELFNVWLDHVQDTANEFVDMILQANLYSGFDVAPYLDFIEYQLAWFDKYYQKQSFMRSPWKLTGYDGDEKLMIFPGSGAETYKEAYNPVSTTSGLRKVITDLLAVNQFKLQNRTYYEKYLTRIPETTLRLQQGQLCISPALAYARVQNSETPQLYPVFPWGEFGLGKPNLTYAINTYMYDTETQAGHGNKGWNQDVIWMARMGLTKNATEMTEARYTDSTVCKFPVFKGPNFDWTPDLNHFGAAAIGLHEQLIQTFVGNDIRLLAAWPNHWNARFKVHAPFNTTIGGVVENGVLDKLSIVPKSRSRDVVYN